MTTCTCKDVASCSCLPRSLSSTPSSPPQPSPSPSSRTPQPIPPLYATLPRSPPTPSDTAAPAVTALLGRTRAAVLHTIAEHPGCTTKELAFHTGIAPASASEHASTLRAAKLITTSRHRNTALHTPTPLGIALLDTTSERPPGT
ncbi:winged helix-turn-helix domain-containing protein [Streptomyces afghaniensis]|uniref:winged helix-turn-helix domain-containing protein n=1 Tax=Streptomyces afghaniensis TaxID=66865 RepID=UPI0027D78886|nr:winged helix-turn-helix domain-containing protein [Streptomyces afghaniensis]